MMNWWKTKRKPSLQVGAYSDVGQVRTQNEDSFGNFTRATNGQAEEHLFIVADGMGGHERGEEASQLAVQMLRDTFFASAPGTVSERLKEAFEAANTRVFEEAHDGATSHRMGTTCTALALVDNQIYMAHVGDSRAYRIDHYGIEQVTRDHTLVEELRRQGILSEDEARHHPRRHALTRALGIQETLDVDVLDPVPVTPHQYYLLCSDGLAPVTNEEIRQVVLTYAPQEACERLVQIANERGGPDNVTVVLVSFA